MSQKVSCQQVEKYQVLTRAAAHAWLADEPPADGGDGLGPNPFELLLSSVGSCAIITVVHYAGQAGIALGKCWVEFKDEWVGEGDEEKYHVDILLRVRGVFKDRDLERLQRAASRCPIKRLLDKGAVISTRVEEV